MEHKKKKSDIIDLQGLLQQYKAKWYLFAISIIGCMALAFFYSKIKRPVYEVTAHVLIDTGENDPMSSLSLGGLFGATNYVDDEIFIISSHSLYTNVAKELGLDRKRVFKTGFMQNLTMVKDYPIDIIVPQEFADTTRVSITFKLKVDADGKADIKAIGPKKVQLADIKKASLPVIIKTIYGDFTILPTANYTPGDTYKGAITVKGYQGAAEDLDQDIQAFIANKRTHVIELLYPTDNPEFGKQVLNTVMAKYDERVIGNKNTQGNKTLEFLDNRIAQLGEELAGYEKEYQQFKESNNIVDIKADTEFNYAVKGEIAQRLYDTEGQLEIARIAVDFVKTPGNEYSMIPISPNQGVNAMIVNYNELAVKRLQLMSNAKEDNLQVKNIEKQMDAMRNNIVKSLETNYNNTLAMAKELRSQMNETNASLSHLPNNTRVSLIMSRDINLKARLYILLLEKREETAVMLSNAVSKGVVVDPAFVPSKPISMGRMKMLAIALVLGFIFPIIFLYLRKIVRGKPESRQEIEGIIDAPVIGEVSTSKAGTSLVVTSNSTSSTVELFKLIRTNLQLMLKKDSGKVVMVTSSQSGEGKSFISINIAASLALTGKKVLLVGLDIRKPMLAVYLNLPADHPGLTNYLADNDLSFASIVQKVPQVKGLDVVVAGIIPPNPAEMLLEPRLQTFFETARAEYDYIIVDSAPVGMVSDSFSVADMMDASIYVTRIGATHYRDLNFLNSVYDENRLPRMTVVINGVKTNRGYGYGYGSVEDHGKHAPSAKKGIFGRIFGSRS